MRMSKFQFFKQADNVDCGPTCLKMISKHYGKTFSSQMLRERVKIGRSGASLLGLSDAAESLGFRTVSARINFEQLIIDAPLPLIAHWNQNHFVVLYDIVRKINNQIELIVADPAKGMIKYNQQDFQTHWASTVNNGQAEGIVLLLEPTPSFYETDDTHEQRVGFKRLVAYLIQYRRLIVQLFLGLLAGSFMQLLFPFLTQSVVDVGINTKNLNFLYLVLVAQLILFLGRISVEFIRSWILLQISTRINVSILSEFLSKLMRLPLWYFDSKQFGDIMQRISDHHRIESFLTNTSLSTFFSMFNLLIFGVVLAFYNLTIFGVFGLGSVLYAFWVILFLKQRRILDFKRFDISARNQNLLVQLIYGMQEIKLSNSETQKRWEWERVQAQLFKMNARSLRLNQYQQAGGYFINEGKNIVITFLAAYAVINGQLTLGAMVAMQYIIGQLNSPVEQLVGFSQSLQDAKISLERLNEIHLIPDEENKNNSQAVEHIPSDKSLTLRRISFKYPEAGSDNVIQNLSLDIPSGKTVAIVGMSGSGKTTLLKLMLKFYKPSQGEIAVGNTNLDNVSHHLWRSACGAVLQDGYIFSDSIARNIAVGDEQPKISKIVNAAKIANISEFIDSLPLGYNTKIGAEGVGLSQGQRQRILIARAVYKEPAFLFFDEATNALDANNEMVINRNLESFFVGRTVVIVAHRLSTVKNADMIVVLDKGEIIEQGTHIELTALKGAYYQLVKNQLEMGV